MIKAVVRLKSVVSDFSEDNLHHTIYFVSSKVILTVNSFLVHKFILKTKYRE